jgi:exonuclease III
MSTRTKYTKWTAGLMGAALLAGALVSGSQAAAAELSDGTLLVVTGNVEEAYNRGAHTGDLRTTGDVDTWVKDLVAKTPRTPDVVLLQEVRGASADYIATQLRKKTGDDFRVAVNAGATPVQEYDKQNKQIIRDTAIILNKTTMSTVDRGGFLTGEYPASASNGGKLKWKKTAYMLAEYKATGAKIALASVHFTTAGDFKDAEASNTYRGKWANQIVNKLDARYPNRDATQIGGDFNAIRCWRGSFNSCQEASFWKLFTSSPHNFSDLLWDMPDPSTHSGIRKETGVDYIFSSARPLRGDVYKTDGADHKVRWALVNS